MLKSWTKKNIKYEICQPEKIVMIGDQVIDDILFGNLNNMANVWINSK